MEGAELLEPKPRCVKMHQNGSSRQCQSDISRLSGKYGHVAGWRVRGQFMGGWEGRYLRVTE